MPTISGSITPDGALVELVVGVGSVQRRGLLQAGRPIPQPVTLKAVVDTGAEATCLDVKALGQLGRTLAASGFSFASLPGLGGQPGALQGSLLQVAGLTLANPAGSSWVIPDHPVLLLPLAPACEALVGRDVLSGATFVYDGRAGAFELRY